MDKTQAPNIYTSSQPFYWFAKMLGLFPLSYIGPAEKGILTMKWHGVASTVLAFKVCVLLTAWSFYGEDNSASVSNMMSVVWIQWSAFGLFLVMIQLFIQFRNRESMKYFLRAVNDFDKKVCVFKFNLKT